MDDDLDRVLSGEEDIVPSSGFTAGVMEAVRREASVPPPLSFPWKHALPGLAAWVVALSALVFAVVRSDGGEAPAAIPARLVALLEGAKAVGAEWIVLALLVSYVSVRLSLRLVGGRS